MPFTTAAKNAMLGTYTTFYAAAFTADPGQTGASEVTGGTYARVQGTFTAAANGTRNLDADVEINIPAGVTVTHAGWFTAATGGQLISSHDIADESYNSAGTLRLTAASTSLSLTDA